MASSSIATASTPALAGPGVQTRPWAAIRADLHRLHCRFSWGLLLAALVTQRNFRALLTHRLCNAAGSLRLLHRWACASAGIDLPRRARLGPGLAITHGWGLVVSPGATVGANCTLFHGVTLGRRDRIAADGVRSPGYPIIEDEVWIGPHAVIVGAVRIGRGSRIAAGAFVTEDVPAYSSVGGNPARVIKDGCHPDVENKAPL